MGKDERRIKLPDNEGYLDKLPKNNDDSHYVRKQNGDIVKCSKKKLRYGIGKGKKLVEFPEETDNRRKIGTHGVCSGTVRIAKGDHVDSLICPECQMRIKIPKGMKTFKDVKEHFEEKRKQALPIKDPICG